MSYATEHCSLPYRAGSRRVVYSGSIYWEGYFVDWTKSKDGQVSAVIETKNGSVRIEDGIACLEFVDQPPT